ncbi:ribosome biogenesis GTPase [Catenibacillus scindens]|uniref:Small ribosomal subunit biogenesis GTPase RsgA n=1 Tax=Catenibacillus scindens TaxID=673271 RepID=A0A7W8HB54_9FIRM|nr:ribosome small subunit-dependent GTPase A [Catenibacillus scindens]MBB5264462.1 ribosome biogenesis GTPase [Catenibacillus scindens]
MQGKIIKGIAGFYYVHDPDKGVYACKAKGIFRNEKIKPLVGDMVEYEITHEGDREGNVIKILPRKNALIRPAVANVDQAMIVFAVTSPAPNLNMLDRFLITMERQNVDTVICFNKTDISDDSEVARLGEIYKNCGSRLVFTSVERDRGIETIRNILKDKTTVLAGPSGVGKSSMMNLLKPEAAMATGDISHKIQRGRHTTRHSQLFHLEGATYVMDTPGFTSLYINDIEANDLKNYFAEFVPYEDQCRFNGCVHIHEPDCAVKAALDQGKISRSRYEDYVAFYNEIKSQRRY